MTEEKNVSNIPEIEKKKIEAQNKIKYALKRLDEMKQLFLYLEKTQCNNRSERKQFKRDFISNDKFAISLIDKVIAYYEVGGNQIEEWEKKQLSSQGDGVSKKD